MELVWMPYQSVLQQTYPSFLTTLTRSSFSVHMVFIPALLRNVEIETVKLTLQSQTLIQKKTFRLGMQNKTLSSTQGLNIRRVSGHQQSSEIPEESFWECWTLKECLKETLSQKQSFHFLALSLDLISWIPLHFFHKQWKFELAVNCLTN